MRTDLNLFIDPDEDPPALRNVWIGVNGKPTCTVDLGTGTIFAAPRSLRAFAEQLLEVADEACRLDDQLTADPLPFEAA